MPQDLCTLGIALKIWNRLDPDDAKSDATQSYLNAYELLEAADPGAKQAFAAVVGLHGEDPLAMFHLQRALAGECSAHIAFSEK